MRVIRFGQSGQAVGAGMGELFIMRGTNCEALGAFCYPVCHLVCVCPDDTVDGSPYREMRVRWTRGRDHSGKESDWFVHSGDYRILKYQMIGATVHAAFYTGGKLPVCLGSRCELNDCKRLCDEHREAISGA